jgi:hypothetical protein
MSYMDFSSWPRDQEQSFVVYEQRQNESSRKAIVLGSIVGAVFLVFGLGIYAGVTPKDTQIKGMNMNQLTKQSQRGPAPAPAPAPKQEAPKQDTPPSSDKPAEPDKK